MGQEREERISPGYQYYHQPAKILDRLSHPKYSLGEKLALLACGFGMGKSLTEGDLRWTAAFGLVGVGLATVGFLRDYLREARLHYLQSTLDSTIKYSGDLTEKIISLMRENELLRRQPQRKRWH